MKIIISNILTSVYSEGLSVHDTPIHYQESLTFMFMFTFFKNVTFVRKYQVYSMSSITQTVNMTISSRNRINLFQIKIFSNVNLIFM